MLGPELLPKLLTFTGLSSLQVCNYHIIIISVFAESSFYEDAIMSTSFSIGVVCP